MEKPITIKVRCECGKYIIVNPAAELSSLGWKDKPIEYRQNRTAKAREAKLATKLAAKLTKKK